MGRLDEYLDQVAREPVEQARALVRDYRAAGDNIWAYVEGREQKIWSGASGVFQQIETLAGGIRRASLPDVFAAMSSLPGVAPVAGPLAMAAAAGQSLFKLFSSLFEVERYISPTIAGVKTRELSASPLWPDRHAELIGRLADPNSKLSGVKADISRLRTSYSGQLKALLDSALRELRGRTNWDPADRRGLCMALAQVPPELIWSWRNEPTARANLAVDAPNIGRLLRYGGQIAAIREMLGEMAMVFLGEASEGNGPSAIRVGTYYTATMLPVPQAEGSGTVRCTQNFHNRRILGRFSNVMLETYSTNDIGLGTQSRPSERDVCEQTYYQAYGAAVTSLLLPSVQENPRTGRYEKVVPIGRDVLTDEAEFQRRQPQEFVVYSGKHTFEFKFDGRYKRYGMIWPNIDEAIVGAISLSQRYPPWLIRQSREQHRLVGQIASAVGNPAAMSAFKKELRKQGGNRMEKAASSDGGSLLAIAGLAGAGLLAYKYLNRR